MFLKSRLENYKLLLSYVQLIGKIINTAMNILKCEGPARKLNILVIFFNPLKNACFLSFKKRAKYTRLVYLLMKKKVASSKILKLLKISLMLLGYTDWQSVHFAHSKIYKFKVSQVNSQARCGRANGLWYLVIFIKRKLWLIIWFYFGKTT